MDSVKEYLPTWTQPWIDSWNFRFTLVLALIVVKIVFATLALTEILGTSTISQKADDNSNVTFWLTVAGLVLQVWYLWKFRNYILVWIMFAFSIAGTIFAYLLAHDEKVGAPVTSAMKTQGSLVLGLAFVQSFLAIAWFVW